MTEKKLEDWMRLILLNWVVVSMTVFYAILLGTVTALATAGAIRFALGLAGVPAPNLSVFPAPAAALMTVTGGWIMFLVVAAFRTIRYRCQDGSYFWRISRVWGKRAGQCWVGLVVALLAVGLAG